MILFHKCDLLFGMRVEFKFICVDLEIQASLIMSGRVTPILW